MPLDIDRYAHISSPLQRWDPRVKILFLGIFVISVAILKTLPMAIAALVIASVLLRMSNLPGHFIAHGMEGIMIFLLPFFLIMPFTYPGHDNLHFLGLPFAWEGLRFASLIFIKATAIVFTSFAIFGTSRFDVSMIALQHLKCPIILTQMLLFTYRYTFTFLEEMHRMRVSMNVRGFIPKTNAYTLRTFGNFIGTLLVRSFERTERVYKAMLSKGYQGEFHSLVKFKTNSHDGIKAVLIFVLAVSLLSIDNSGLFIPAIQGWY
jgi:cobalt/nickel transport system permease protein